MSEQPKKLHQLFSIVWEGDNSPAEIIASANAFLFQRCGVKKEFFGPAHECSCYRITPTAHKKLLADGFVAVPLAQLKLMVARVNKLNSLAVGQKIRVQNDWFKQVELTTQKPMDGYHHATRHAPKWFTGENYAINSGNPGRMFEGSEPTLLLSSNTLADINRYPKIEVMDFRIRYRINEDYGIYEIKCPTEAEAIAIYQAKVAERSQDKFTPAMVYLYESIEKENVSC